MTTRLTKHPILRLEVLGPDGTRTTEHRVFCRRQHHGVSVEACCGCVHCDAVSDGPEASIECWVPDPQVTAADDAEGLHTEVGTLLCTGAVVVSEAADLKSAFGVLRAEDRRSVAVVNEDRVLVGLVHETTRRAHILAGPEPLTAVMSTALAIHERTPVRTALRLLAANHAREAMVVTDKLVPLGTFRDIDGLHFVSRARAHAEEPRPSPAPGPAQHGAPEEADEREWDGR